MPGAVLDLVHLCHLRQVLPPFWASVSSSEQWGWRGELGSDTWDAVKQAWCLEGEQGQRKAWAWQPRLPEVGDLRSEAKEETGPWWGVWAHKRREEGGSSFAGILKP